MKLRFIFLLSLSISCIDQDHRSMCRSCCCKSKSTEEKVAEVISSVSSDIDNPDSLPVLVVGGDTRRNLKVKIIQVNVEKEQDEEERVKLSVEGPIIEYIYTPKEKNDRRSKRPRLSLQSSGSYNKYYTKRTKCPMLGFSRSADLDHDSDSNNEPISSELIFQSPPNGDGSRIRGFVLTDEPDYKNVTSEEEKYNQSYINLLSSDSRSPSPYRIKMVANKIPLKTSFEEKSIQTKHESLPVIMINDHRSISSKHINSFSGPSPHDEEEGFDIKEHSIVTNEDQKRENESYSRIYNSGISDIDINCKTNKSKVPTTDISKVESIIEFEPEKQITTNNSINLAGKNYPVTSSGAQRTTESNLQLGFPQNCSIRVNSDNIYESEFTNDITIITVE